MTERVQRPEEIITDPDERTDEQTPKALRCRAGSKMPDGGCQRDATTWMYPNDRDYALCDEHARLHVLSDEAGDWGMIEEITLDWLRMARTWRLPELEQFARNAHESAKEEFLKAEAKVELAEEVANAPRREDARVPASLRAEKREELRRRMRRSDELNNAYTAIEDAPEGQITEDRRRSMLAVLVEEKERAHKEYEEYRRELGLAVLAPSEPESGAGPARA